MTSSRVSASAGSTRGGRDIGYGSFGGASSAGSAVHKGARPPFSSRCAVWRGGDTGLECGCPSVPVGRLLSATNEGGPQMGIMDKAKDKAQSLEGEAKQRVGGATGDESLQAEGKKDQVLGDLKGAGEKVKDAVK